MGYLSLITDNLIIANAFNEVFEKPNNDYPAPSWYGDFEKKKFFLTSLTYAISKVSPETIALGSSLSTKTLDAFYYSAKQLEDMGYDIHKQTKNYHLLKRKRENKRNKFWYKRSFNYQNW